MRRVAAICAHAWLVVALLPFGCAEYEVRADFDPAFDFASCRTYDWLLPPDEKRLDPRVEAIYAGAVLRRAIAAELDARSLGRMVGGRPDLLVDWDLALSEDGRRRQRSVDPGRNSRESAWSPADEAASAGHLASARALLTIDLLDPASRRRVWRGTALTDLQAGADSSQRYRHLSDAIRALLAQYPPGRG